MTFNDLSTYRSYMETEYPEVRNVGWLGEGIQFTQENPRADLLEKLHKAILRQGSIDLRVNRVRGIHPCEICGADWIQIGTQYEGERIMRSQMATVEKFDSKTEELLGMYELWIPDPKGGYLCAPSLIYHYINTHSYAPPREFWDALESLNLETPYVAQSEFGRLFHIHEEAEEAKIYDYEQALLRGESPQLP